MISVFIPYYESHPEKRDILKKCVKSLKGADEIIIVSDEGKGITQAVNLGFSLCHGDYLICCTDDIYLTRGNLQQLTREEAVTSPSINEKIQDFWGMVFCVPRWVYTKVGGFDPEYNKGIYYEDEDYKLTLMSQGIPVLGMGFVNFDHPKGGTTVHQDNSLAIKTEINKNYFFSKWKRLP